jgi:ATP-dependent DNA helicase RecQ
MSFDTTPLFLQLMQKIAEHWGYRSLRPLQEEAMRAHLENRDSVVVMPTGGGKSLCFQAPALIRPGETTVVVSPLIALMKDQVDNLRAVGIHARQIDHLLSSEERLETFHQLRNRKVPLLFVSPERLMLEKFQDFLQQLGVKTFVIDEAHCISHWGHDFRTEYRQLSALRTIFPHASFHAYTATATEGVRKDIVQQLGLKNPSVLVGSFDRPNLTYRVLPRQKMIHQILEVLHRHPDEAGIIYCFRKKDVDDLTKTLQENGFHAMPYHADLSREQRKATHDAFRTEKCNLVIATVAFGMGIDRSNIRFVIHAATPASIEHFQQETGRAGRDGLEAECVLLHSLGDVITRKKMAQRSVEEGSMPAERLPHVERHLELMNTFCRSATCRHRLLVEHFGQTYEPLHCQACDICFSEVEFDPESTIIAQKILSCVSRIKERFGVGYLVDVLRGSNSENVLKNQHDQLSTFGLLKEESISQVRDWVFQLIQQGLLEQTKDEYPILKLNDLSWQILRKEKQVSLLRKTKQKTVKASKVELDSWEGVDQPLAEKLRRWRRELAEAKGRPPFGIFDDRTLRELCRIRPSSLEAMKLIYGLGSVRIADYGQELLNLLKSYCEENSLAMDQKLPPPTQPIIQPRPSINSNAVACFPHFRRGASIKEVMEFTGKTRSTVLEYLATYIQEEKPNDINMWVESESQAEIINVARQLGTERLKPIFVALDEKVSYDTIRLVLAYLRSRSK